MIRGVQYLRAVAALLVVWHHARIQLPAFHSFFAPGFGERGVDLFFVISGFIMVVTTHGRRVGGREFFARRVSRVVPLYWIATLCFTAVALVAPHLLKSTSPTPAHVIQSLLFIPHLSPTHPGAIWPILVPGWTLNYEMFFYAVFALCLACFAPHRTCLAISVVLGSLMVFGWLVRPSNPILSIWTSSLLVEFLMGVWLGRFWIAGKIRGLPWPYVLAGLVVGATCLFADSPLPRGLLQGFGAALIVSVLLGIEFTERSAPITEYLGDASYSIYLTHIFTLGLFRVVWQKMGWGGETMITASFFMLAAIILSSAVGALSYACIERPTLSWSKRWFVVSKSAS